MNSNPFKAEIAFTETYKKYENEHVAIREAMCLRTMFTFCLQDMDENEYFAGGVNYPLIGFALQEWGYIYYCDVDEINKRLDTGEIDEKYREQIEAAMRFWKGKTTNERLTDKLTPEMKRELGYDHPDTLSGANAAPRICSAYLDFHKLITLGLPGMLEEVEQARQKALHDSNTVQLFEGMKMSLDTIKVVCISYAQQAKGKAEACDAVDKKQQWLQMANILEKLTTQKPETMREAIQLSWLYSQLASVRNYGRMDMYLGDLYVHDLENGVLDEESALDLVQSLWRLINKTKIYFDSRVIIGGKGRPNEDNADRFALLAIEATRTVKETIPQLSLRFYEGMNPKLMEMALTSISEGRTFPMLYNDDVNIPAVKKAFDIPLEDAEHYVPYGCGEYTLDHRYISTPAENLFVLQTLMITLYNGIDPLTGVLCGLKTGEFKDFTTYEAFYAAYKKQLKYFSDLIGDYEYLVYETAGEDASHLYLSMLYDDCIQRGKGMFSGGVRYLGGTPETYGNTNAADSLAAVKYLIYDKKLMTHETLLEALRKDFVGFEREHILMLKVPKYGNDDDYVDDIAMEFHRDVCNFIRDQRDRTPLDSLLLACVNNQVNTFFGLKIGASPDGRRSTAPMANANNPTGGQDKNGITAFLNSLVKLDPSIHGGFVQNMKFGRELFQKARPKVELLLDTYFKNGGTQAMITVVNRGDLENALREPHKYPNLIVRIGGFSARFVELDEKVQRELLSRTLYD